MQWDISPIAFSFGLMGDYHFNVRWYGLFFASTFLYGIGLFRYLLRRDGREPDDAYDLALFVIAGTVIGARLGHVLFYRLDYFIAHPLKVFAVWEGGLTSHGAVVGILVSVWLYSRQAEQQSFLYVCDRIGLAVPFSGCLIRLGNFFNSELLGTPTDMPWAVVFARIDTLPRHPVQLYESACYLLIFLSQLHYYRQHGNVGPAGYMFGRFFLLVFGARFVLEFFKEEQAAFATGWTLHMAQWLSLPAMAVGLWLIWRAKKSLSNGLQ